MLRLILMLVAASQYTQSKEIRCMNFYGLETPRRDFVCSWAHDPEWYLKQLQSNLDINTIRLPFSRDYIQTGDFTLMDLFISKCKKLNMEIILDYHRTWESHQGPTPEEGVTLLEFVNTWLSVCDRYHSSENVIGIGIFNEYQGMDVDYLKRFQRYTINAIETAHPNRFEYYVGCTRWGGDCAEMNPGDYGVEPHRVFIESHKYSFSGQADHSDWEHSIPRSVPPQNWLIGETGWKHGVLLEREWAERFLSYLEGRNITNVCAWTIAHSGDTEGWWNDNCQDFDWSKAALLKSLWTREFKSLRGYENQSLYPFETNSTRSTSLNGQT